MAFLFLETPAWSTPLNWTGTWQGGLNTGAVTFRIALVLKEDASGAVTAGTFNNIDDGIYNAPLQHLSIHDGELDADLESGEKFQLRLKSGGLQGQYLQAKGSFQNPGVVSSFQLKRGDDYLIPRISKDGIPETTYVYQEPLKLKDGWKTGDWAEAGLDVQKLKDGLQKVTDGTYPHIHSVQLVYKGRLLLDEYFYGYVPADLHPLQSQTKSIFSILFGIARDQGRLGLDEKLYDFFPEFRKEAGWSDKKDQITLRDLLTMSSGFACNDWKDPLSCSWAMVHSADWLNFSLHEALDQEPGSHFAYCGACLLPLSVIVEKRSGLPLPDFAQKYLWEPLGIRRTLWFSGPQGVVPVSFGLQMRPRDLLKLGFLYLNHGLWKGRRVLSEDWIEQSSSLQIPKAQTNGKNDYGYLWWEREVPSAHGPVKLLFAWGVGGQYLFVVPERQLVCVVTGGNYKDSRLGANSFKLFQENLLAALP